MGEALIRGLLDAARVQPQQVIVSDVRADVLEDFSEIRHLKTTTNAGEAVTAADIVVLAVKPQQMSQVLQGLRPVVQPRHLFISIAAGIPTRRIEEQLGGQPRVIRVMPNTPALLGKCASAQCLGKWAVEEDARTSAAIMEAVGMPPLRVSEDKMDAVTALSGSGPAYIFLVTEAMILAGIESGLNAEEAERLAIQTVYGAASMMLERRGEPAELRKKVTSPGGTTEAALKVMSERKLMEIFRDAIAAATKRGRELSGG